MNNNNLPSAEEFISSIKVDHIDSFNEYSEPKYKCPMHDCTGGMCKNTQIVLTSNPPKFIYKCNKCGHIDYLYK